MAQALSGRRLWFNSCILLSDRVIPMCQLLPISELYRGLTTANKNTYSNTCTSTTNSKVLNAFTYDGNDDSPKLESTKGGNNAIRVSISPNPNNGAFTVNFDQTLESTIFIKLMDSKGQIVYENTNTIHSSSLELNLQNLGSGIYFLMLSDNNTLDIKEKLVILNHE